MHCSFLLQSISNYRELWVQPLPSSPPTDHGWTLHQETERATTIARFAADHPDCFERTCVPGHITGSALVVSPSLDAVLLTLHRKLGIWLQLGGHSDGDPLPFRVAMREAREESGLEELSFLPYEQALKPLFSSRAKYDQNPLPFDLDCHLIPARKGEPEHIHYDVRYLIVGDPHASLAISEESHDLRWFSLAEARVVTQEASMLRQFAKLDWLRSRIST